MKFDENTKCITLLFGKKVCIYLFINICSKIQSCYFKMKFDENTKCITLLFGKELYINLFIDSCSNIQITYYKVKFDENTKCIALPLVKNYTLISLLTCVVMFKVFIIR